MEFTNVSDVVLDFGPVVCTSPPPESLTGLPATIMRQVDGQSYGLEFRCETVIGLAHQRIAETLREGGYDLLFIGAYGHSRIIEMVLGSTTEYVLRNSPCPVFLAR